MAHYPSSNSADYKMPPPAVPFKKCTRQHINLRTVNHARLFEIIETLEQKRPAYIEQLCSDPFIALMQQTFDAEVQLPVRQKHMIVIYGPVDTGNTTLINKLKSFFEIEQIVTDWNGEDEMEETRPTLLFTTTKPPYTQPYNALSIEGAQRLLAA